MATENKKLFGKKSWLLGAVAGIFATVIVVLSSGFMIDATNKDVFCASCHIMEPFQQSWKQAVHGGNNRQGFAAQCVDCHLPHGNFLEYIVVKGLTGASDIFHNIYVDGAEVDWQENAEKYRLDFTYESGCRHCHSVLTPPGLSAGGFIAHRSFLRGTANRTCAECHPHVGHENMVETAEQFFGSKETAKF